MLLITGANGQLGSELKKFYSSNSAYFAPKSSLDILDFNKLEEYVLENDITGIINCAGYTNVDKAEEDIKFCNAINIDGTRNLAKLSKKFKIPLVHISTDYVFDGKTYKPYVETSITEPLSVYGKAKLVGEAEFLKYAYSGFIIRTGWLYSEFGKNFVKTILKLAHENSNINVVADQIGTPTYACDLANIIFNILEQSHNDQLKYKEIYHFSNEGVASWYDFAFEIIKQKKLNCTVTPIMTEEYPTKAKRPYYSVLNKTKIKQTFEIQIRNWKAALEDMLKHYDS